MFKNKKNIRGNKEEPLETNRRSFLKLSAASLAGGAASLAANTRSGHAKEAASHGEDGLYRETEHVRKYYDLARF